MPPFRDDHILIISPGSKTTCAQLGLPESFTPPKLRIPSRMFPGIEGEGTWTFTKIREARDGEKEDLIAQAKGQAAQQDEEDEEEEGEEDEDEDDEEEGDPAAGEDNPTADKKDELKPPDITPARPKSPGKETEAKEAPGVDDDQVMGDGVYVEDEDDEEGAVWCMKEGKIIDWSCFFALLTYVHETINPTFHTPILMLHPPTFSASDKEMLTQFVFEKLKAPGFALVDAATSALWAYGLQHATVIDVGYEKTDITPISDFIIQDRARETVYNCGGETMTKHLNFLLPDLKHEDAERLKTSPICEILPPGTPLPGSEEALKLRSASEEKRDDDLLNEEDGTVNVAAIVASGKTHEFLSKKEREKRGEAERRLPNRERVYNTFWTIDKKKPGEDEPTSPLLTSPITEIRPSLPTVDGTANGTAPAPAAGSAQTSPTTATAPELDPEVAHRRHQESEKRKQEKRAAAEGIILADDETWVEVSIGTERFRAAECGILQDIADVMFRAISKVEDVSKRADLWDSIIIVGNGAKVKGFKEAFLQTLQAKYLIPPSTGTIFSSELPSSLSTPIPTGASTPQYPSQSLQPSGGPNPLLVAATTANLPGQSQYNQQHQHHSSHGQTPMSMKLAKMPEYFPEWKDVGFDEAGFLGAQVLAKVLFVVDQGQNMGFMTRVDYNENGPEGIHDI